MRSAAQRGDETGILFDVMPTVLESHLALLEREAFAAPAPSDAGDSDRLEQLVALHVALYEVLERRLGPDGLVEAHRPLVPMFQRWLETARQLKAEARRLRVAGQPVPDLDDLLRAMNRAKCTAEAFDHFVALNERLARGEKPQGRPLAAILDELRITTPPVR
jgi:phosphoglycolate phosphatase-like HAD superfamily hydrolase